MPPTCVLTVVRCTCALRAAVNLMIAKMTSTYEKIQQQSLAYRAEQQVSLIAEFKDERGPPPPFNIITSFACMNVNNADKG